MAVNETRNLSQELRNGLTDGSVKRAAPDRGGDVEGAHTTALLQQQYGAVKYDGSAYEVDQMANRVHDGTIVGAGGQGSPDFVWTNTVVAK